MFFLYTTGFWRPGQKGQGEWGSMVLQDRLLADRVGLTFL